MGQEEVEEEDEEDIADNQQATHFHKRISDLPDKWIDPRGTECNWQAKPTPRMLSAGALTPCTRFSKEI